MAKYANPDALVETAWLADHLDDPNVRIVEVDEDTAAYGAGHIPNAAMWNWNTHLHAPVGRDYLDQHAFVRLAQQTGVGSDTTIVLYGGNNNWFASYAYWLLKYLGFDRVRLLNGGRKKWELEGRQMTQEIPTFTPTTTVIPLNPIRGEIRAMRDEVLTQVAKQKASMIDVRSPEEYRGEKLAPDHLPQEQAQVPGHIPGAVNIPWAQAANDDGTFKSADALKRLYGDAGVTPGREVVAYCRIGERSSHTWFALHELLGYGDVKNYDGSWTEYGSLVGAPCEMG